MSMFRKKSMNEKAIEILWKEYEAALDNVDKKVKSIEALDQRFYEAKQEYEHARAAIVSTKEQWEAEALELKRSMDVLSGKGE